MRNIIEIGDIVYSLRYGTADKKFIIDKVTEFRAYSGDVEFIRHHEFREVYQSGISRQGFRNFGQTFIKVAADWTKEIDRYDREIVIRSIRNANYSQLSLKDLVEVDNYIKNKI